MGFPESIAAYPDVQELFDKALASEKGLKLTFKDAKEATINAGRMNAYRVRLRRDNARVYPADHKLHKATPYDGLMIRKQKGSNTVLIEKLNVERFDIEELK